MHRGAGLLDQRVKLFIGRKAFVVDDPTRSALSYWTHRSKFLDKGKADRYTFGLDRLTMPLGVLMIPN